MLPRARIAKVGRTFVEILGRFKLLGEVVPPHMVNVEETEEEPDDQKEDEESERGTGFNWNCAPRQAAKTAQKSSVPCSGGRGTAAMLTTLISTMNGTGDHLRRVAGTHGGTDTISGQNNFAIKQATQLLADVQNKTIERQPEERTEWAYNWERPYVLGDSHTA